MELYRRNNPNEIIILAFLCLLLEAILIVSDVLTFKTAGFLGIIFTLPALLYPMSYAIGDTLTEVYGRKATLIIFIMAICIEFIFDSLISYSATVKNVYDQAYYAHFYYALGKMNIAGLGVVIGSVLGFSTNTIIMQFLKTKFSYRSFPIRSIFSSLSGELIFTITAFFIWFHSDPQIN
ncbi:MAG: VUT family protein, partial [Gammaproteobacteria bacterium]